MRFTQMTGIVSRCCGQWCICGWLGAAAGSTAAIWEWVAQSAGAANDHHKKLLHDLRDRKETKLVLILVVALRSRPTKLFLLIYCTITIPANTPLGISRGLALLPME